MDKPIPPLELQHRTTGESTDQPGQWFHASGRQTVMDFEISLAAVDRSIDTFPRILDFGCGCGRSLMWLEGVSRTCELHGVDTDAVAIDWVSRNVPFASFKHIHAEPPLPYPDGFFDLVVNHSVFTHIDERLQDLWLSELGRVTKPGGVLVLSVHGEHAFKVVLGLQNARWRREMETAGILFVADDDNVGGPFPDYYHSTFHAPWYVFSHWGREFTVRAHLARRGLGFQDYVVLERPSADTVRVEPIIPRVADAGSAVGAEAPSPAADDGEAAVRDVAALLARGVDCQAPTRYGAVGHRARRLLMRILRHYEWHQRAIDSGLLRGVREVLTGRAQDAARLGRVEHTLAKQAQRIGRLEQDVLATHRPRAAAPGHRSDSASGGSTGDRSTS